MTEAILTDIELIANVVRVAIKTDTDTALYLHKLDEFLTEHAKESRAIAREVLTDRKFGRLQMPVDWKDTKYFAISHETGTYALEYPDRLCVISDGKLLLGEPTAERPSRIWCRA